MGICRMSNQSSLVARIAVLSVLGFSLLFSGTADASLFMRIDGIPGDSTESRHRDWIDVSNVEWGVSMIGSVSGGGSGRPVFSDLGWDQVIDSSFPKLFSAIANGNHIKRVQIDFTSGCQEIRYFDMIFDNVLLTNLTLDGKSDSKSTVSGSFSYGKITMDYFKFKADGSPAGTVSASYDLQTQSGSLAALADLYVLGSSGPPDITTTPVPAAAWLFATGLAGLAGIRRRISRDSGA